MPLITALLFWLTTLATIGIFYHAMTNAEAPLTKKKSSVITLVLLLWLIVQALITISGFYYKTILSDLPPKLVVFGVAPMLLTIIILFSTRAGRSFIDSLPLKTLTWLHVIRLPVEIVLYLLFLQKVVPLVMTFEGRNFDILMGISAPLVAYYGFIGSSPNKKLLLIWNVVGIFLLLNIVIHALLSVPGPLQRFGFERPNIAVVQYPYSWLPTFIVPVVLFSHLVAIRRLTR
ncbi:MAG: hypothetical protein J7497_07675 [Chitinophagaceae bacterium]|nr:hypothetical protein [Chitinophagaceae bacterium]